MNQKPDHSSRAHALLSASSSARWLACPPSAVAAAMYPSADTEFTREGTLAHEVAEIVARSRVDGVLAFRTWADDVTPEMVRCAEAYADYILELVTDDAAVVLLEQRVDFSPWVPGGFGTCDCLIIQGHRLDVVDYKYGQGVAVSAEGNSQMSLYGLGALHAFGMIYDIQEVVLHIFQPRINNISAWHTDNIDLRAWGEEIQPLAFDAAKGKGEMSAGEHCRFCPHAGKCPELARSCMKTVKMHDSEAAVPSLLPWQVADILKAEPMISKWLAAVKDRALAAMMNGGEIPGYKVVEGRGSRAWTDEEAAGAALVAAGYDDSEICTEPQLLSVAQMEKALGKKRVAEICGALIESKPGNPTVAPESDKRKPFDRLAAARNDFNL